MTDMKDSTPTTNENENVRIPEPVAPDKKASSVSVTTAAWSGPLPPPGALREFELIKPGLAERIVALTEREADHRHKMANKVLDHEIQTEKDAHSIVSKGQWMGFSICILISAVAIAAVIQGQTLAAVGAIILGLAALVSVFMRTKRQSDNSESNDVPKNKEEEVSSK